MFRPLYRFFHRHYHLRYHGIYHHAKKLFVFDLFLLALAIVMLAVSIFFFFWKPGIADQIDLSINLDGGRLLSGNNAHLIINFANKSKFKLKNTALAIQLPSGFVVDRYLTPTSVLNENSIFTDINEIDPGATGQKEIYGIFWGETNQDTKITATLSFVPEDKKNREQKMTIMVARFTDSVISSKLQISTTSFAGQLIDFTYQLKNASTNKIDHLDIAHSWQSSIISSDSISSISLLPDEIKIIKGQITAPKTSGKFTFTLTPQVVINGRDLPQNTDRMEIEVFAPQITSAAYFFDKDKFISPGDSLPLKIIWQNKSKYKLYNLRLRLSANEPKIIDWIKTARENNTSVINNELIITSSSRTMLSQSDPQSGETFSINLFANTKFNLTQAEKIYLEITPTVEAELSELRGQKFYQAGLPTRLPVATEIKLNAATRFYHPSGDQLGRFPLPPRVNESTIYWIFIQAQNSSNPISHLSVSTTLPKGIEFTGKQSVTVGSPIKYDPINKIVSWSHTDQLPANSFTGLYFEVKVTPSAEQRGQIILLTNNIYFNATDDFISQPINLIQKGLTNVLQKDDLGNKYGAKVME